MTAGLENDIRPPDYAQYRLVDICAARSCEVLTTGALAGTIRAGPVMMTRLPLRAVCLLEQSGSRAVVLCDSDAPMRLLRTPATDDAPAAIHLRTPLLQWHAGD